MPASSPLVGFVVAAAVVDAPLLLFGTLLLLLLMPVPPPEAPLLLELVLLASLRGPVLAVGPVVPPKVVVLLVPLPELLLSELEVVLPAPVFG
jgi:hypothetical protein